MKGKIYAISKDVGAGLIKTESGSKYLFALKDWYSDIPPANDQMVQFEIGNVQTAIKVRLDN